MIKAIANQKLDLSQEEYDYYLELEKIFGKNDFIDLFKTDHNGQIISVLPSTTTSTAMILIYFLLNVMFNQRLRRLDHWMLKVEQDVKDIQERLNKIEKV